MGSEEEYDVVDDNTYCDISTLFLPLRLKLGS